MFGINCVLKDIPRSRILNGHVTFLISINFCQSLLHNRFIQHNPWRICGMNHIGSEENLHISQSKQAWQWRHNECYGVSNRRCHDCLLNHLFGRRSKKWSKLRVTGLCEGNSPVTGEFPSQRAGNAENVHLVTSSWKENMGILHKLIFSYSCIFTIIWKTVMLAQVQFYQSFCEVLSNDSRWVALKAKLLGVLFNVLCCDFLCECSTFVMEVLYMILRPNCDIK